LISADKTTMTRFTLTWFILALLSVTEAAWPATGFPFLRVSAGARAASLGEAVTAVPGADPLSVNPAALASSSVDRAAGRRLGFSHSNWIQGISHDEISIVAPRGSAHLGFAAQLFRADGLERRVGPTRESLGDFGVYEWAVAIAGSKAVTPSLIAGIAFKLVRQSIYTEAATGGAADVGLLYASSSAPWQVGATIRNLGSMNELDRESTDLPRQIRVGSAYRLSDRLGVSLDGQWNRGVRSNASGHLGAEWHARDDLILRGGYQTADSRRVSGGLGLKLGRWLIDYAYVPFQSDLGEAHRFSIYVIEASVE
jgi:hypothetical protein